MSNQEYICAKYSVEYSPCNGADKLGIALETLGKLPINALRLVAENGTCGWYIWCGEEWSDDPNFFKPLHVSHIKDYLPQIEAYLALPPGYRVLIADGYEDVWQDPELIGA